MLDYSRIKLVSSMHGVAFETREVQYQQPQSPKETNSSELVVSSYTVWTRLRSSWGIDLSMMLLRYVVNRSAIGLILNRSSEPAR